MFVSGIIHVRSYYTAHNSLTYDIGQFYHMFVRCFPEESPLSHYVPCRASVKFKLNMTCIKDKCLMMYLSLSLSLSHAPSMFLNWSYHSLEFFFCYKTLK